MPNVLQNNKVPITLGTVKLFCLFVTIITHLRKLQCYHVVLFEYGSACPKFSKITNSLYLWKALSDFVDFLHVVICILSDIHWSYKNMLFWACTLGHRLSANGIVRCFKLKELKNYVRYQVDFFFHWSNKKYHTAMTIFNQL